MYPYSFYYILNYILPLENELVINRLFKLIDEKGFTVLFTVGKSDKFFELLYIIMSFRQIF